jgi:hypothetical protein
MATQPAGNPSGFCELNRGQARAARGQKAEVSRPEHSALDHLSGGNKYWMWLARLTQRSVPGSVEKSQCGAMKFARFGRHPAATRELTRYIRVTRYGKREGVFETKISTTTNRPIIHKNFGLLAIREVFIGSVDYREKN